MKQLSNIIRNKPKNSICQKEEPSSAKITKPIIDLDRANRSVLPKLRLNESVTNKGIEEKKEEYENDENFTPAIKRSAVEISENKLSLSP